MPEAKFTVAPWARHAQEAALKGLSRNGAQESNHSRDQRHQGMEVQQVSVVQVEVLAIGVVCKATAS
jgi:hypothetical protein